jgi:hypothetical protein
MTTKAATSRGHHPRRAVTILPEVIADLPVGLYAEPISRAGQQQRNFPRALTHPALISAAFNLDRALGA